MEIFPKKLAHDGRKLGKQTKFRFAFFIDFLFSDDVKKRYEQKAAVEKQKYEVRVSEYKKSGGGGGASSPAKASKGASKASSSKKSPRKPAPKKGAAKAKSSDEEDDDEDEDDED